MMFVLHHLNDILELLMEPGNDVYVVISSTVICEGCNKKMQGMANNVVIHLCFFQNQVQTMAVAVKLVSPSTLLTLLVSL